MEGDDVFVDEREERTEHVRRVQVFEAGVLAFHDHGGNEYFGQAKITRTSDQQSPRRTRASTRTTGSIGTRSKSRPKTMWKAIALAEL
jgi:hypothetical protein